MSLTQMHLRPNRFAAWVGVLAILMLFIAPVISKSLARTAAHHTMANGMVMADHDPTMSHHAMPMGDHDPVMPAHQSTMGGMSAAEHARMMAHHPMSMMDDNACGYCVLLAHLPLDLNKLPPLWTALQAARLPSLPFVESLTARFTPAFFHPRAPPVF